MVMELIEGKMVDPLDAFAIERVAKVLDYFTTLRGSVPRALSRGPCRELPFPDTSDLVFETLDEMKKWWNSRILPHEPKLTFQGFELVFCHLDMAPRNILWLEDGSICIVDWNSAGYYPKLFEFCSQWIIEGRHGNFNSLLLNAMSALPVQQMVQKTSMHIAWRNIQRYAL